MWETACNYSFSDSIFFTFRKLSTIFIKFKIFIVSLSIQKSLNFDVWERFKDLYLLLELWNKSQAEKVSNVTEKNNSKIEETATVLKELHSIQNCWHKSI